MEAGEGLPDPEEAVRFEDLTVDDDLPILERIVRYTCSQIALQRLVHVKMLGETAELAGMLDTQDILVPLLNDLVTDAESVIRQHLAAQLLTISIVCMLDPSSSAVPADHDNPADNNKSVLPIQGKDWIDHPAKEKVYNEAGYQLVTEVICGQLLQKLLSDVDVDVRRAAADALTGLALQIRPADIGTTILPIPLQLAAHYKPAAPAAPANANAPPPKKTEAEQQAEEWRMTAANLLAELGGAVAEYSHVQPLAVASWGTQLLVPAILELVHDPSFRVRRAAAQALPRILGAAAVETVTDQILPAFEQLSRDELYRVRKSTGECLVDMSRSLVILASMTSAASASSSKKLLEARRSSLIPIADRLIQDEHKMVRQGMMQFLGPFMASFYPFSTSPLAAALPATSESDGSNHMGIVAQFFPHATSMVSRLNSSQTAVTTAPTPVLIDPVLTDERLELERLQHALPTFLQASRQSARALHAVRRHRVEQGPPAHKDLEAIVNGLLDYFAALAIVQTGDENTDAEMRVYCAYSFPAVVLLLGPENWPGALKTCFLTLLNPSYADEDDDDEDHAAQQQQQQPATEPPLPVKRCLASSLHTVAHVLGPDISKQDILPVFTNYFLRDGDEAVRLNMIRGFPTFLGILPSNHRTDLFLQWAAVMHGEDCLGAKNKRSATNPLVLNWRQRNYLARSLPDLLHLLPPDLLHQHVWPLCQELLLDSVSLVRDDALWTLPVLLRVYTPDTIQQQWPQLKKGTFSGKAASLEIIAWFKEQVLKLGKDAGSNNNKDALGSSSHHSHGSVPAALRGGRNAAKDKDNSGSGSQVANFADRQLFCRLCGTIGLSLRLDQEIRATVAQKKDLAATLGDSFVGLFFGNHSHSNIQTDEPSPSAHASADAAAASQPYQKLTTAEYKHLKKMLEEHLLPTALTLRDDRIRNVRVTLLRVLQILPRDVLEQAPANTHCLQTLQEEVQTWESFGGETDEPAPAPTATERGVEAAPPPPPPASTKTKTGRRSSNEKGKVAAKKGPVDVDEVGSRDTAADEDDTKRKKKRGGGGRKDSGSSGDEEDDEDEEEDAGDASQPIHMEVDTAAPSIPSDEGAAKVPGSSKDASTAASLDQKYQQTMDKFREQTYAHQEPVSHDHSQDTAENPQRINLQAFMNIAPEDAAATGADASNSKNLRKHMKRSKSGRSQSSKDSKSSSGGGGGSSPKRKSKGSSKSSRKPTTQTVPEEVVGSGASVTGEEVAPLEVPNFEETEALAGWKTVLFEDGPIGLQLEPTVDDQACRVYGFLETGTARKSGKIQLGDVIVKVNQVVVQSYDETVELLKRGGRRAVTFRPGEVSDDYVDSSHAAAGGAASSGDDEPDTVARKKKSKASSSSSSRKKLGGSSSGLSASSAHSKGVKTKKKKSSSTKSSSAD